VGFALATVGIVCVEADRLANMMAVVMNAQRGSGGFIFLALPFFVLAGFIMDRATSGAASSSSSARSSATCAAVSCR
jgi:uncharacterized membrane protein